MCAGVVQIIFCGFGSAHGVGVWGSDHERRIVSDLNLCCGLVSAVAFLTAMRCWLGFWAVGDCELHVAESADRPRRALGPPAVIILFIDHRT